jgi:hypothetical protein
MLLSTHPVEYRYNKFNGWFAVISLAAIIGVAVLYIISNAKAGDNGIALVLLAGAGIAALMLVFVVSKYFIPALKGDIALEINVKGIKSYLHNISISWADVDNIEVNGGRMADVLYIHFKQETDYGDYVRIPLQWITGNDDDIYETAKAFWKHKPQ